jgi:hypothetical protein
MKKKKRKRSRRKRKRRRRKRRKKKSLLPSLASLMQWKKRWLQLLRAG